MLVPLQPVWSLSSGFTCDCGPGVEEQTPLLALSVGEVFGPSLGPRQQNLLGRGKRCSEHHGHRVETRLPAYGASRGPQSWGVGRRIWVQAGFLLLAEGCPSPQPVVRDVVLGPALDPAF